MNIKNAILKEHSKKQCEIIVKYVGKSPERFAELMKCFFDKEYQMSQRAAWPVSYCVQRNPELIKPYLKKLLDNLSNSGLHDSIPRNTIRLLQYVQIPKRFYGRVMDICLNYISSPTAAVAIKAFSITVLQNLAKEYPEIINEIKLIIDERWDYETAAFKARARKILKIPHVNPNK